MLEKFYFLLGTVLRFKIAASCVLAGWVGKEGEAAGRAGIVLGFGTWARF